MIGVVLIKELEFGDKCICSVNNTGITKYSDCLPQIEATVAACQSYRPDRNNYNCFVVSPNIEYRMQLGAYDFAGIQTALATRGREWIRETDINKYQNHFGLWVDPNLFVLRIPNNYHPKNPFIKVDDIKEGDTICALCDNQLLHIVVNDIAETEENDLASVRISGQVICNYAKAISVSLLRNSTVILI